jgi:spore maturation protein SpmB
MAQIIKHRRGTLESLIAVTGSLLKGEIVIATGSTNLSPNNGESVVFVTTADGRVEAVNRIMRGDSAPNAFAAGTYNGIMDGVPYYASASNQTPTLFLFGSGVTEAIDLIGNIQPFSTSVDSRLDAIEASIGGGGNLGNSVTLLNTFSASAESRLSNLETKSGSVDVSLSNINLFTSSQITKNSTLENYTSSIDTKFSTLATYTGSNNTKWTTLENVTSSVLSFTSSTNTRLSNIELTTASILVQTSNLELFTSSQNTKNSTLQTYTSSLDTKLSTLSTYTSSVDDKLTNLINVTGSYATTGSNTFFGTQVFSGSVYIQNDLIVIGSSSIQNISASVVNIGDNQITLNTFTPPVRFGGISIIDSGSSGATGSLWWDSVNNRWIYEQPNGSGEGYNSALLIAGPQNSGGLGSEIGLTTGKITLAVGDNHISSSQISDDGTTVNIPGALTVGTLTGIGVVATFSSSVDSRLDSLETSIGGGTVSTRLDNLELFTASQNTKNSTLATYTGSVDTKFSSLATYTGSVDTKLTTLQNVTSSILSFTASQETKNSTLATYTGSINTKFTDLATYTGSVDGKFTNLATYTGSVDTKFSTLQNVTSSILSFTSSQETKNSTLASYTGSNDTKWSTLSTYTGSVNSRFTNIELATASLANETANLELFTSSQNTKNSTLATYTSSVDTKFGTLATYTASVDNSLSSLNSYSSSLKTVFALAGSDVTMNGNATITGDLVVQGNTVTFNTTNLVVEDKLIELASGSTNATQANGAGISVLGANATLTYESTRDAWTFNKPLSGSAFTGSLNVPGGASSKRIAFRGTTDNIEFVAAPSTNGDLVQWNGSDFIMSNVIDGGSF